DAAPVSEGLIRYEEIKFGKQLGEGSFGMVYQAVWKHDDVAVKKIKDKLLRKNAEAAKVEFIKELKLLRSLTNRHVVQCFGGHASGNHFFIVTELMERGSLADCLDKHADEFAWARLGKKVLLGAAKGLLHIHSCDMVHFDIKPLNVLINEHNTAKLADVGLAKRLTTTVTKPGGWTPAYAAPEILNREGANQKSDIFSFGLMIWQVYTQLNSQVSATNATPTRAGRWRGSSRAPAPHTVLAADRAVYSGLITRCWQQDPAMRPSMQEVAA
ncbi:hypothetical protein EMIHUDRAFT_54443, partial [Emiliania huxleyi CCMP1516]|uniref:Protein kinase domain-containing protein n=2 Tax=Emiliania huxleyi TaxID=2903 RepID=A0A0D3KUB8_EMIH1